MIDCLQKKVIILSDNRNKKASAEHIHVDSSLEASDDVFRDNGKRGQRGGKEIHAESLRGIHR